LSRAGANPFAASQESELALDLRDVQLARYLDYLPLRLPIQLVSGALDSDLKLAFRRLEDHHSALSLSGSVAFREVVVKDPAGAPLLSLKRLEVLLGTLDPLQRNFVIERVAVDSPEIHARVSRQGTINWIDFLHQELAARRAAVPEPAEMRAEVRAECRQRRDAGGVVAGRSEGQWWCPALARRVARQAVQRERSKASISV
jgi:hypothetical protein